MSTVDCSGVLLVVDDDPLNRDMLQRRLERRGYTVLTAASGEAGLEAVQNHQIDLVLLDVLMPGITGLQLLEILRRTHPIGTLPIIMVTAQDESDQITEALQLGANDYLTKPIDFQIALARIRSQLGLRAAVQDMQRAEQQYRMLFENSADGLYRATSSGRFMTVNPAMAQMLGYGSPEELLQAHNGIATLLPGATELFDRQKNCWTVGEVIREECEATTLSGEQLWVAHAAKLALDRGDGEEVVEGSLRDVTAQKQAEAATIRARQAAEEAARAKNEFLATMSHEIRTPMNAIIGAADLLSATRLDEEQRRYVDLFRRAGESLLWIINDILDLSRIESGRMVLEEAPFALRPLLQHSVEIFAPRAAEKQIELTLDLDPALPAAVRGDAQRLHQILLNLVGNAVKFTEKGAVSVQACRGTGPETVRIEVRDTGIGIPAQKQGALFTTFTQADSSTSRKYGGAGLGLAICRKLVTLMGGSIGMESEPGVGSLFWFEARLPPVSLTSEIEARAVPDAPYPVEALATPGELNVPTPGILSAARVLIAEDSSDNQLLLKAYLAGSGLDLTFVPDGAEAVEEFKRGSFDLVLMDVQMPGKDGYAATREIRAWEESEHRKRTPILALTANAFREDEERSLSAGCDAHLTKPIRREQLLRAIAEYGNLSLPTADPRTAEEPASGEPVEADEGHDPIRVEVDSEIADLIPGFLDNRTRDTVSIRKHLDAGEWEAISRIGHSMKGAGGGYGFPYISSLGGAIEQAARMRNELEVREQTAALAAYLARVVVVAAGDLKK